MESLKLAFGRRELAIFAFLLLNAVLSHYVKPVLLLILWVSILSRLPMVLLMEELKILEFSTLFMYLVALGSVEILCFKSKSLL